MPPSERRPGLASAARGATPASGGRAALLQAAIAYFAENGIDDVSLRQIAAGVGTSHRMLIYHFGSRDGLLTAVVEMLEEDEKATLARMVSDEVTGGRELAWRYWQHAADSVQFYGPLYFALASHAMRGDDLEAPLRRGNVAMWLEALTTMWSRTGELPAAEAAATARLNLAVARGLLHDLLLTHDRRAVDVAMARFDWLVFGTPHPLAEVRKLTRRWSR
jgi:AcrR family transcriptional regulator